MQYSYAEYDLIVIGGGPAGLAAALTAYKNGVKKILLLERGLELGGILNQCIHNGFGLHHFGEELTGPEYAARFIAEIKETTIDVLLDTIVLKIIPGKLVHILSSKYGFEQILGRAIVLAMGCRERTRGQIGVHGSRPAGVFTAGTAQNLINMEGLMPGKKVVILGSGDIGLIMARRMTLEGARVKMVLEILPYSNGLTRNIVQCLNDFNIPLLLSHTVLKVHGEKRVTGVTIAKVDNKWQPVVGSEELIPCDTLLLAVGLIPENELSRQLGVTMAEATRGPEVSEMRQTNIDGIFACGNVLQVHDIVDFVSEEGAIAGIGVAKYLRGKLSYDYTHKTVAGSGIAYVLPHRIAVSNLEQELKLFLRVKEVYEKREIVVKCQNTIIMRKKAPKFLPAEMVDIKIAKETLANNPGDLVVEII